LASGAAKRYAQAVLSLAKERGTLDAWRDDLARLNELVSDPRAAQFFANPNVSEERKLGLVEQVLADAQAEARNLARLLVERGRLEIVPQLFAIYAEGLLAERGIAIAEVTTAEPLGAQEQALVRDRLARLVGKQVELRLKVDPSIIGGVVARVGDQLIDGSVVNQLRRLRARLAASA
jgi:F-type H+-transporting ATPase subunit delta